MREWRTPQMLRDQASAYRQDAAAIALTLPYMRGRTADDARLRRARLLGSAGDLERLAMGREAIGV